MKRLKYFFIIVAFASSINCYAQDSIPGFDCLGTLCTLSVDLNNDPTTNGYLEYEIPFPPEGVYSPGDTSLSYVPLSGPGQPYVSNVCGHLMLYIKRKLLIIESIDQDCVMSIELPVNQVRQIVGSHPEYYMQCYYLIKLNVTHNRIVP